MKKPAPATLEPIACTLVQFRTILYPCSRASANVLVQSGELESFVHNGRRMVLLEKAREFVARNFCGRQRSRSDAGPARNPSGTGGTHRGLAHAAIASSGSRRLTPALRASAPLRRGFFSGTDFPSGYFTNRPFGSARIAYQ